ncbi:MAG: C4-dicarboxylate transporter DctA [Caulobacter sp.]|nr:C4-dicarboxylate transporter DctA [Caulobacter sp.]
MRFLRLLYVQVLLAIAAGIALGALAPGLGTELKPLADAFIKLIKLIIAPVIFCTVAAGIGHMSDMAKFGRVGARTLLYFVVVSSFALVVGLVVGLIVQPGVGMNIDPAAIDPASSAAKAVAGYADKAAQQPGLAQYLLHLIPDTFFGAFTEGAILPVLVIAVLTGFACARLGEFGDRVSGVLEDIAKVFFSIIHIVVRFAPIGAFGAMAYTIGEHGLGSLVQLGKLILTFYATSLLFVLVVLGAISAWAGFSIFKFLRYIREELLIVLGTSSSESVLPQIMEKLQRLGASRSVTGLVIPTGYSFNLDGTNIYMTLAILFLAQATNTHLDGWQLATLLGVAVLTSKGAAGITGAGFIALAATIAEVDTIPLVALAVIFGIDRFMSECRALTNLVGNGVATLVIARWEGELDVAHLRAELDRGPIPAVEEPLLEPAP